MSIYEEYVSLNSFGRDNYDIDSENSICGQYIDYPDQYSDMAECDDD